MISHSALQSIAGYLPNTATNTSSASLSTTVTKVTLITPQLGRYIRLKIKNLNTATNRLAYAIVPTGASAPTISADPASATPGTILNPNDTEYLIIPGDFDLYVVGSAASTIFCVTSSLV